MLEITMNTSIDIMWYGRGGQGAFSAAKLLGASYAFSGAGRHALAFPSFGPERRGAPVHAYTRLSTRHINDRSVIEEPDYIICLDETLAGDLDLAVLKPGGAFLCVNERIEAFSAQVLGRPIVNTALLALLCAHTGLVLADAVVEGIRQTLPARIQEKNIELVQRAFAEKDELLDGALRFTVSEGGV